MSRGRRFDYHTWILWRRAAWRLLLFGAACLLLRLYFPDSFWLIAIAFFFLHWRLARQERPFPFTVRVHLKWPAVLLERGCIGEESEWDDIAAREGSGSYDVLRVGVSFTILPGGLIYCNNSKRFKSAAYFDEPIVQLREFGSLSPPTLRVWNTQAGLEVGLNLHVKQDSSSGWVYLPSATLPAEVIDRFANGTSGFEYRFWPWTGFNRRLAKRGWNEDCTEELRAYFPTEFAHKYVTIRISQIQEP